MSSASCSFAPNFCSISLASASSNGSGGTVTLFGLILIVQLADRRDDVLDLFVPEFAARRRPCLR